MLIQQSLSLYRTWSIRTNFFFQYLYYPIIFWPQSFSIRVTVPFFRCSEPAESFLKSLECFGRHIPSYHFAQNLCAWHLYHPLSRTESIPLYHCYRNRNIRTVERRILEYWDNRGSNGSIRCIIKLKTVTSVHWKYFRSENLELIVERML